MRFKGSQGVQVRESRVERLTEVLAWHHHPMRNSLKLRKIFATATLPSRILKAFRWCTWRISAIFHALPALHFLSLEDHPSKPSAFPQGLINDSFLQLSR